MVETWQENSTDSLKKSSSKAIPRSQTKATLWPKPIGFPSLAKVIFSVNQKWVFVTNPVVDWNFLEDLEVEDKPPNRREAAEALK